VELLGVSTGLAISYGIGLCVVLIVAPAAITALKGQWMLFVAGWLTVGIVWWIAALRLGQPRSWWARHRYGPDKLARARSRYGDSASDLE
jgi:hypothetical protein